MENSIKKIRIRIQSENLAEKNKSDLFETSKLEKPKTKTEEDIMKFLEEEKLELSNPSEKMHNYFENKKEQIFFKNSASNSPAKTPKKLSLNGSLILARRKSIKSLTSSPFPSENATKNKRLSSMKTDFSTNFLGFKKKSEEFDEEEKENTNI